MHAEHDDKEAKIWLDEYEVARNHGFASHEITDVIDIIAEHRSQIIEGWYEHCGHR